MVVVAARRQARKTGSRSARRADGELFEARQRFATVLRSRVRSGQTQLKECLVKRTSQVKSPRHPSIAAIRTLLRTVGIGVSRSAVNNPRDRSKSMFFVRNAACTSKIQARRGVGIWSFACLIALAGASLFAFGAPARAADGSSRATNLLHPGNVQHAVGYILVGSYAGASEDDVEQVLEEHGGRSLGKLNGLNVHVMEVPPGFELDTAARLAHNPHVRFAEVDQLVAPAATATDPYFPQQ